jgi:hypothetical protein
MVIPIVSEVRIVPFVGKVRVATDPALEFITFFPSSSSVKITLFCIAIQPKM